MFKQYRVVFLLKRTRMFSNNYTMDKFTTLALLGGVLLRLAAFQWIPHLPALLDQFVLFSTPINSYRSLNEGIFLLSNDLNPYKQGEILHHPPILLWFFNVLKGSRITDNLSTNIFFSAIDLLICLQLIKINRMLNKKEGFSSFQIAGFYMFNPFSILSTLAKSTYIINNLLVTCMMAEVMTDNFELAVLLLSISAYLTYYSWYLLIPIAYYLYINNGFGKCLKLIMLFISAITVLLGISYKLCDDSFNFISLCYMTILRFEKITPNLGLWWYFFTEIFDFFNNFYLAVFNIYSFVFVVPLTMRFILSDRKIDLLFVIWIIVGLINFSKAYPVLADYTVFYSAMFLFKRYYHYLKFKPAVSFVALIVVLLQSPTFYIIWMSLNSGNANFFYAMGLALSLVESLFLSDFIWAYIQDEYYSTQKIPEETRHTKKLTQI